MARKLQIILLVLVAALPAAARSRYDDYALVLEEAPVAERVASRAELQSAVALGRLREIQQKQAALRSELERRQVRVIATAQTLVNAVFVRVPHERASELQSIAGVKRVEYLPPIRRHLDRALPLVKAIEGWNALGGQNNAGTGIKIAILDTGIDQNHPAFQDPALPIPDGFPKGLPQDRSFTNNKIIVARSYVAQLANPDNDPQTSRPDDFSPRDRSGHGTAVAMVAAGVQNSGPAATITGVAPKAYLGNYKIFGTPGVNDTTTAVVIIQALEDALNDGMDIASLSVGNPAVFGPLDRDPNCGNGSTPADCDVRAQAVENAVRKGLIVVISAGNDGNAGVQFPTLNSIETPGTAPSAITVGASTNAHVFFASVEAAASGAPAGLQTIDALFGDGPRPSAPLTAPLRDVSQLQDDGLACAPLTNGSLSGAIALIQRGTCTFTVKVNNAQKAGAVGVVLFQESGADLPFSPLGLTGSGIPAVMIGNGDGNALKSFLGSNPDSPVTLDPALHARDAAFDTAADFSSRGPSIGEFGIKPELVAVGTDLYTATESSDPNGDLFEATGYTAVSGTSFSAPMVAGAAALVKQRHGNYGPAQVKSAVVNTATSDVREQGAPARVTAVGAGKLNVGAAVTSGGTVEPATLAFGIVGPSTLPVSRTLRVTNTGTAQVTFNLAVAPRDADNNARVALSSSTLNLAPGQQGSVTVQLQGNTPAPGSYEGALTISGGGTNLRVPYLYQASDGVAFNIFPVANASFTGVVNDTNWLLAFKLVDRFGAPVFNAPVRFRVVSGGGSIGQADATTDRLGIAAANVNLGPLLGDQIFEADAGGLTVEFDGFALALPTINNNGVVNAASLEPGRALAPGSYATIFGSALSQATRLLTTTSLPFSMAGVSVSFDGPGISAPGRLSFVSDRQINVQIPWELSGLSSARMKVSIGDISSAVVTVPLADASPAIFEFDDPASGRRLGAVLDQNFGLVTPANPAHRGQAIQIFANGLGPVDNQPASGEPSSAEPLARTRVTPTVMLGGRPAQVLFSGLTPGSVGLYQINVIVPPDSDPGIQPMAITINGIQSKAASLPVQ